MRLTLAIVLALCGLWIYPRLTASPRSMPLDACTVHSPPAVHEETIASDGERIRTVVFGDLLIDGLCPSMSGPSIGHAMSLAPSSRHLWITRCQSEVVDNRGQDGQQYLCHNSLLWRERNPEWKVQMAIGQGQKEIVFPAGFALCLPNAAGSRVKVVARALNYNQLQGHPSVHFKTVIHYYDDEGAAKSKLRPLSLLSAEVNRAADHSDQWMNHCASQWMVPPGRQSVTLDITSRLHLSRDVVLHAAVMHLHPFGESLELRDATDHRTVWKGSARNSPDPNHAELLSTDTYSSAEGQTLPQNHRYELTTVYHNTSHHPIDAMGVIWLYVSQ